MRVVRALVLSIAMRIVSATRRYSRIVLARRARRACLPNRVHRRRFVPLNSAKSFNYWSERDDDPLERVSLAAARIRSGDDRSSVNARDGPVSRAVHYHGPVVFSSFLSESRSRLPEYFPFPWTSAAQTTRKPDGEPVYRHLKRTNLE